jgi:endonuclease/exonuclease/phosphatase family metal-dependent hydrolase
MKRFLSILFFGLMSAATMGQYSAMTYNIRYSTPNDGENWWEYRKAWVAELVNYYAPDVLGIQEGLHSQVSFLDTALTNYNYVGVGRDDGDAAGEYTAIFYKSDKLKMVTGGTFWLSETPDKPSFGWGANFRRISTWARFKVLATGEEFFVFNAHLDHEVARARLNAVKLIHQKAKEMNGADLPVILMGDLNAIPDSPPIQFLRSVMRDSKEFSQSKPFGPEGTFNGFDTAHPLDRRIDYIFVDGSINVLKYAVLAESRYQRTPSDHLPVLVHFSTNKSN